MAQHGLADTVSDLAFNALGGIVLTRWGIRYLVDLTDAVISQTLGTS